MILQNGEMGVKDVRRALARRLDIRRGRILPYTVYRRYLADGVLRQPKRIKGRHPVHRWADVEDAIIKLNEPPKYSTDLIQRSKDARRFERMVRKNNEPRTVKNNEP